MSRVPKYRRHTLRDFAFVEVDGKRVRLPGRFGSVESRAAYRKLTAGITSNRTRPDTSAAIRRETATVADIVLLWLDHCKAYYVNSREYNNCRGAGNVLVMQFPDLLASEFGPRRLKELQSSLADQKLSRGYIGGVVNRVRRCWRWAVSEELVSPDAYAALVAVQGLRPGATAAVESAKKGPVTWESVELVCGELSPTVAAMVKFQWFTGCRSDSLCNARGDQFDRTGEVWEWRPKHKTQFLGRSLVLPIGPQAQAVIRELLDRAGRGVVFVPSRDGFNRVYGERYTSNSYGQAVKRAIIRLNAKRKKKKKPPIPSWTPHQLRHSRGHLVRERYGIEAAQAVLGHDSLDATEIYSARRLGVARDVAKEIG